MFEQNDKNYVGIIKEIYKITCTHIDNKTTLFC